MTTKNETAVAVVEPEENVGAIVPLAPHALALPDAPLPVFTGEQMLKALTAYRDLQHALDKSMPDQIMLLDGKPFRKKGYWRAIAVAFNLKVEPINERRDVSGVFADGRENFGYVVDYKATAPNGRSVTADGSCFAVEKARRFKCPHPERPGTKRTLHFPHTACPDYDPAFQWKTLPAEATEHNVRSHAHTRAFNRAVSSLVGFGEVSAEEVNRDEVEATAPATTANGAAAGLRVVRVYDETTKNGKIRQMIEFSDGKTFSTIDSALANDCYDFAKSQVVVARETSQNGKWTNLARVVAVAAPKPVNSASTAPKPVDLYSQEPPPLDDTDIPF